MPSFSKALIIVPLELCAALFAIIFSSQLSKNDPPLILLTPYFPKLVTMSELTLAFPSTLVISIFTDTISTVTRASPGKQKKRTS